MKTIALVAVCALVMPACATQQLDSPKASTSPPDAHATAVAEGEAPPVSPRPAAPELRRHYDEVRDIHRVGMGTTFHAHGVYERANYAWEVGSLGPGPERTSADQPWIAFFRNDRGWKWLKYRDTVLLIGEERYRVADVRLKNEVLRGDMVLEMVEFVPAAELAVAIARADSGKVAIGHTTLDLPAEFFSGFRTVLGLDIR